MRLQAVFAKYFQGFYLSTGVKFEHVDQLCSVAHLKNNMICHDS